MKNTSFLNTLALVVWTLFCTWFAGAGLAVAQQAEADEPVIEEVVVTATKRLVDESDVAIAIDVFSGEQLEESGVIEFEDLAFVSPSFNPQTAAVYVHPFIRGIGANIQGAYSSVGIYIDGAYQSSNLSLAASLGSLDRVESVQILKGPQGTLYGRNATGGAIIIETQTPQPGEELNGFVQAELGEFGVQRYKAGLSVGGDKVSGSLSASVYESDGFIKNRGAGSDLDNDDGFSISGKLHFEPTDNLSFTLSGWYSEDEQSGTAIKNIGTSDFSLSPFPGLNNPQAFYAILVSGFIDPSQLPTLIGMASQIQFPDDHFATADNIFGAFSNGTYDGRISFPEKGYQDDFQLTLNTRLSFDTFDLVSITTYMELDHQSSNDALRADASTLPDLTVFGLPPSFNQGDIGFSADFMQDGFTQELYAVSTDGPFEWIAGMYYFEHEQSNRVTTDLLGLSLPASDNDYLNESIAAFAEVTWPFTEMLSVTAGVRYTDEEYTLDDHFFGNPATPNVGEISDSEDQTTYNLKLAYDQGDHLVYGGVSTGFKSGSLNNNTPSAGQVSPEEVTSYEIGFKSNLSDGNVRLDGAVFYYDFENIQLNVTGFTSGLAFIVDGVEAEVLGAELSLEAQLTSDLSAFARLTFLDTEYRNDALIVTTGEIAPLDGNDLVQAPEVAASIGLNYNRSFGSGFEFRGNLIGSYNSGYWSNQDNTVGSGGLTDDGFFVTNASLSLAKDNWVLSAYVNNIFEEEYFVSGFEVANGFIRLAHPNRPRHAGVRLRFDF